MNKLTAILILAGFCLSYVTLAKPGQVLKTNLTITVLDDAGNIQEGATVILYKTEEDYRASKNPAVPSQKTDQKGRVKFKDLDAISYFVEVRKGEKNNDGLGAQTGDLVAGRTNKVNIIIE